MLGNPLLSALGGGPSLSGLTGSQSAGKPGKKKDGEKKDGDDGRDADDKQQGGAADGEGGKEGEGEEEEEEEEEADLYDTVEQVGGDDEDALSPEALAWCEELFDGDRSFGKYYNLAKDRSREDVMDLAKPRTWKVRLRNIRYTNHGELGDFFVVFNFGWNFRLSRKLLRTKVSKEPRKRDKSGRAIEKQRWKWVKSGTRGVVRYTEVKRDVEKGRPVEFWSAIEFTWRGSYFDLYSKVLHAEVWIWHEWAPNEYLAKAEKSLKRIASGEMNMSGPDWQIKTETRRKGRLEQVVIGALQFQCVFQEVLSYQVRFQNWVTVFTPWYLKNEPDDPDEEELLYPYVTFCLHSRLRKVSSKSKQVRVRASEQHVKMDVGQVAAVRFLGTRLELEEGILDVELLDNSIWPFKNDLIGRASIPLTSVVENGFLSSKLVSFTGGVGGLCGVGRSVSAERKSRDVGQVHGTVDVEADEYLDWASLIANPRLLLRRPDARLQREFAQVGDLDPPELKDYPPHNLSYLAVHIVAARDLVGADANGLSDPYATVEWAGQRLKTRTLPETLDPIFDEVLYFQVHAFDPLRLTAEELSSDPFVRITLWDADDAGSSDLLGTAKLYLHQVTGCYNDSAFPVVAPQRMQVRRRKRGKRKLRLEEIRTRVFSDELRLEGLPKGVDSFVKVAAWFRGPEGDLKEPDGAKIQERGTELLLLPNMRERELERLLPCLCYSVDTTVKDSYPPRRRVCNEVSEGSRCSTLASFAKGVAKYPTAARALDELMREMRIENLLATNQYGEQRFLPTYLQPLSPPKSMWAPYEQERALMAIRTSQKENLLFEAAGLVRAYEFWDTSGNFFDGAVNITPYTWLSPNFFMSMKKGDNKAHVLLLANLFLGVNADVYVCVGYARRRISDTEKINNLHAAEQNHDKRDADGSTASTATGPASHGSHPSAGRASPDAELVPHVWIMTRHSDSVCCVRNTSRAPNGGGGGGGSGGGARASSGATADVDGAGEGGDFAFGGETAENGAGAGSALPLGLDATGGAIKFWEASRGAYYPPLPNRWAGQDDEKLLQALRKNKREHKDARASKSKKAAEDSRAEDGGGPLSPEWQDIHELTEDDMLNEGEGRARHFDDQSVPIDEIFELGAGMGDSFGYRTHQFHRDGPHGAGRQGAGDGGAEAADGASDWLDGDGSELGGREALGEDEDDVEAEEAGLDDGSNAKAREARRQARRNRAAHKARRKWVRGHAERTRDRASSVMPYEQLLFVFNHRNLWVNVQDSLDPRELVYDIEDGEEFGWRPLVKQDPKTKITCIAPHYPGRALGPKLTEEKVAELQNAMAREIASGIENFRNTHNVWTRFAESSTKLPQLIASVLEAKHRLDMTDRVRRNGWLPGTGGRPGTWEFGSRGDGVYREFESRFRSLQATRPPGFDGRIQFVKVNSSDPKEVRRVVLRRRTTDSRGVKLSHNIHEESHNGRELFAVGVKVVPLPSTICTVYVGVMAVFPKADTALEDAQHSYSAK